MEHDDVLEDLLSWTGDSSTSAQQPRQRPSLQESCVNTASTAIPAGTVARSRKAVSPSQVSMDGVNLIHSQEGTGRSAQSAASSQPQDGMAFALPEPVHARLLPHQRDGVRWLYTRHCKSRACLLADEMGLGKTVQVAAFLGELYRRRLIKTTILVVPPTLVPMWEAALGEWGGPEMTKLVEVVHNEPRRKRQARWRKLKYRLPCVLLTTYGVLRQDATDMSVALVDYVVLDEAHLIKDASTCAFKSALTLSARHKIALSGTPLMNSFDDMWSLFRFLDGSILSLSKAEFNAVSAVLLRGNERDASVGQMAAAGAELAKLQAAIRPFMLRREKKDLTAAVTSTKQDVVVWVRMSAVQRQQYEAFLESKAASAAASLDNNRNDGDGADDGEKAEACDAGTNPLLLLTLLSQICNHPWLNLVDSAFNDAVAQPYVAPLPEMGDVFAGAKIWVALQLLVRGVQQGRKSLVFSRSKRLLRLLSCLLKDWGVSHAQVDGDMASELRFSEVQRFNASTTDPWVCLLTTQVGGVGLTFTAASVVVLLDPSWNPSADAQAVDRVHRIGQTSDVTVYRLVTCGTVEEKIYRNQIFKRMAALQSMSVGGSACDEDENPRQGDASAAEECSSSRTFSDVAGEQTSSELYRYFTRLQLRSMFVIDNMDQSSTARQLEVLHPRRVGETLRRDVSSIDGVCDVSDNTCVLTERVDASGAAVVDALPSPPAPALTTAETHTCFVRQGLAGCEAGECVPLSQQRVRSRSASAPTSLPSSVPQSDMRQPELQGDVVCPLPQRSRLEETVGADVHPKSNPLCESGKDYGDAESSVLSVSEVREAMLSAVSPEPTTREVEKEGSVSSGEFASCRSSFHHLSGDF